MQKNIIFSYLFVNLIINLLFIIFNQFGIELNFLFLRYYSIVFISIWILLVLNKYKSTNDVIFVINGFIFLFIYGRIIVSVIDQEYNLDTYWIINYVNFSELLLVNATLISNIFVITFNLGVIDFKDRLPNKATLNRTLLNKEIIFLAYCIIASLYLIKNFIEFKFIIEKGYLAFYNDGFSSLNYYNPIIKYSHVLYVPLFSFIIIHKLPKKVILFVLITFVFLSLINSLKGARGLFIMPLLFSLWYYNKFYSEEVNKRSIYSLKYIIVIVFIISVSIGLKTLREQDTVNKEDFSVINIPNLILIETGKTFHVFSLYLKYQDKIVADYPYILEPVLYPYFYATNYSVMTGGQTKDLVEIRNSFDDRISYFINKNYYYSGAGLGSSYIIEAAQLGVFFGGIVCFFLGYLVRMYLNNISNKMILYFSPIVIPHIMFIARNNAFPNFISIAKHLFMYIMIVLILYIFTINSVNKKIS